MRTLINGLFFLLMATPLLFAEEHNPLQEGRIHEAFLTPVRGNPILQAIPESPPPQAAEKAPMAPEGMEWIPGYWAWDDDSQDFFWMTGTVRRPPPGHVWMPGKWIQIDSGWVYTVGFWSPSENLSYISLTPPEPIQEEVQEPPSPDSFWMPGYWEYHATTNSYGWVSGRWGTFDPNWIFVPSHYVWTENGYVFIASYWDWPLDDMGTAYAPVYVDPSAREHFVLQPVEVVEPIYIVRNLFIEYPDYAYFYGHHYHFHQHIWADWGIAPSWWSWGYTWNLPWHSQWGLWWWYTHPGYPQPVWMTSEMAQHISPPQAALLGKMKKFRPPPIVTPSGVISSHSLVEINKDLFRNRKGPILSYKKVDRHDLFEKIKSGTTKPEKIFTPSNKLALNPKEIPKPNFPKPAVHLKDHETYASQRVPPKPAQAEELKMKHASQNTQRTKSPQNIPPAQSTSTQNSDEKLKIPSISSKPISSQQLEQRQRQFQELQQQRQQKIQRQQKLPPEQQQQLQQLQQQRLQRFQQMQQTRQQRMQQQMQQQNQPQQQQTFQQMQQDRQKRFQQMQQQNQLQQNVQPQQMQQDRQQPFQQMQQDRQQRFQQMQQERLQQMQQQNQLQQNVQPQQMQQDRRQRFQQMQQDRQQHFQQMQQMRQQQAMKEQQGRKNRQESDNAFHAPRPNREYAKAEN